MLRKKAALISASALALLFFAPVSAFGASRQAAHGAPPSVISVAYSVTLNAPAPVNAHTPRPDVVLAGGGGSCTIVAGIHANSSWSAVTSTAYTTNCVGVAACFQTADMQTYSAVTGHVWTALKDGPETSGCGSGHASVVSVGCTHTGITWAYRTVGHYTVFWSSGGSSSASLTSGSISNFYVC